MILVALVIFSISTLPPVDNGDRLGIITVQAKEKIYQLPSLLGQQVTILVGLDTNPNWAREQSATDNLVYGIAKPDDTVPAGINEDYNHLATSNHDKEIPLFFKVDKKKVTIKCVNHGGKLYAKIVSLSRLVEQSHRTKKRRQQVNKYAGVLRTK